MKAKHVIKRLYELYKAADEKDIEFSVKVNDGPEGTLYLPINPKDMKLVKFEDGEKKLIIDLS